jgi:proteasome accessory factor C
VSAGAREQVARLLTLVPWLHGRDGVRLEDAAAAVGASPQQLLKDLKVLLMCGLPGGYPDDLIDVDLDALEEAGGDGVVRVSNADYLARPLRLSPTEASALVVALRAVRTGAEDRTLEVVDRTLAKLEAAAAEGSVPAVVVDAEETAADPALRGRLEGAASDRRQVRLAYWTPSRDEVADRTVDPRGVVTHRGQAYLDAWCHSAEAPRLFRLDRVRHAEVLTDPVLSPAAPPRDLEVDGLFAASADTPRVTLRLSPRAHWVPEYYPVEEVRPVDDGALEVDLLVADPRWLERLVLRLAPHARVIGPQEFTESSTAAARAALRLYR